MADRTRSWLAGPSALCVTALAVAIPATARATEFTDNPNVDLTAESGDVTLIRSQADLVEENATLGFVTLLDSSSIDVRAGGFLSTGDFLNETASELIVRNDADASISGFFTNRATVEVSDGTLSLYGGSDIAGTVTIGPSGSLTFYDDGHAITGGSVSVADGGSISFGTRLDLTGGTTEVGGTLSSYESASTLAVGGGSGSAVLQVLSGGNVQTGTILVRNGGTVGGNGSFLADIFVEDGGTLAAGTSPGTMEISGNLTLGGTLEVEVASESLFDFYDVQGAADLSGGQIVFVPLDGFQFTDTTSLQFLRAQGGITGTDTVTTTLQGDPGQLIDIGVSPSDPTVLVARLGPTKEAVQAPVVVATSLQRNRPIVRSLQRSVGFRMRQLQRLGGVGLLGDSGILQRLGGPSEPEEESALPAGYTGLSGGDHAILPTAVWADVSRTNLDSSRPGLGFDGETDTLLVGADRFLGDGFVVGGSLGYESTDLSLDSPTGTRDSDGFSGTAYAGLILDDTFWLDALVTYAQLDNEIVQTRNATRISGDFDSHRFAAAMNLNAQHSIDRLTLAGTLGYSWTRESFEAYQASGGGTVDPATLYLGTASATVEVGWMAGWAEPFASATWEVDAVNTAGGDRNGALVAAGLRASPWAGWNIGVSANAEVGRDDEESWSVAGNLRVEF